GGATAAGSDRASRAGAGSAAAGILPAHASGRHRARRRLPAWRPGPRALAPGAAGAVATGSPAAARGWSDASDTLEHRSQHADEHIPRAVGGSRRTRPPARLRQLRRRAAWRALPRLRTAGEGPGTPLLQP